jgi:hypothetical protein
VVLIWVLVLWAPLTISTPEPSFDGPAEDWLAYARATQSMTSAGTPLLVVALFGFLLFAVALSLKLRMAEDTPSVPSTLVLFATGLMLGLWMASAGVGLAASFRAADLDATTASLIYGIANGLFVISWFAMGCLLIAAGTGGVSAGSLPGWLSWPALLVGCAFLVAGAVPLTAIWFAPYFLFYFWVVAVSIGLIRSVVRGAGASTANGPNHG